jgi:TolB protein
MNADGTNKTRVTFSPGRDSYPAFTPDGKQIAFMTDRDGDREIYRCDLDGSHVVDLTNNHSAIDQVPYYSPDGEHISFISYRDGNAEIYVMNADGTNQTRITNNPAQDVYPGWGDTPELLSDMTFDFDALTQRLRIPANMDVSATLAKDDVQLANTTTGDTIAPSMMQLDYDHTTNIATVTFPSLANGSLPDGDYHLKIAAGTVADQLGHPLAEDESADFFVLNADANHDRRVNALDFNVLAKNFGGVSRTFSQGDFNYDGNVNTLDFTILASRFNQVLAAPAMSPPVSSATVAAGPAASSILFGSASIPQEDLRPVQDVLES